MVQTRRQRRHEHLSTSPPTNAGSNTTIEVIDVPTSPEQENTVTSPLSKLRALKNPADGSTTRTPLSQCAREKYATAVQLVKEALATDLTSGKYHDLDSLMGLANKAFASLDGLEADYEDLYKSVEDYLAGKMQISEMESEIEEKKALLSVLSHSNEINAKVDDVAKEQERIEIALWHTTKQSDSLKRRIQKTKTLLEKLEQELKTKETQMEQLKHKSVDIGASHAYLMAKKDRLTQEAETARSVLSDVHRRRDEAEADIEKAKYNIFGCLG